jgi:hypothetical protein
MRAGPAFARNAVLMVEALRARLEANAGLSFVEKV